jgi:hypothetical protein
MAKKPAKRKAAKRPAPSPRLVETRRKAFLEAYPKRGTITAAAEAAGIHRSQHHRWLKDPKYAAAFDEAEETAIEILESEARRRAVHGHQEPVIYQGSLCWTPVLDERGQPVPLMDPKGHQLADRNGMPQFLMRPLTVARVSDTLLIFLLKAKRPQVYRDNAVVEHTGAGGGPLEIRVRFVDAKDGRPAN